MLSDYEIVRPRVSITYLQTAIIARLGRVLGDFLRSNIPKKLTLAHLRPSLRIRSLECLRISVLPSQERETFQTITNR